jgi:hypothetical protein
MIASRPGVARTAAAAWGNDRRMHSPEPPPSESIARQVRITLREHDTALLPGTGPITEITRHGKPLAYPGPPRARSQVHGTGGRPRQPAAATHRAHRRLARRSCRASNPEGPPANPDFTMVLPRSLTIYLR